MESEGTLARDRSRPRAYSMAMMFVLLLSAFNLRPGVTSIGPVLSEISESLSLTSAAAGVLAAIPVLTFGIFAFATPTLVSWFGLHRLAFLAITITGIGLAARPWVDELVPFFLLTAVGLSGLATLNVILPSLVRRHFANSIGLATALYTTALGVGLTAGALLTYPIAARVGVDGWRFGLTVWGLTALVGVPVWLLVVIRQPRSQAADSPRGRIRLREIAKTRLGRFMATFFGLQSLQAFVIFGWFAQMNRDAGHSPETASLLLATVSFASMPAGFIAAWLATRANLQAFLVMGLTSLYIVGYIGLIFWPTGPIVWLWAVVIGVGQAVFPVIMTLIGLKATSVESTAGLSAFTQSWGYLFAALGPFAIGLLHATSGSWTVPLLVLIFLAAIQIVVGWFVIREPSLRLVP